MASWEEVTAAAGGLADDVRARFEATGLGLLASYLLVKYINEIHQWLGRQLGVQVWNPEVYLFDKIPNTMNPREVTVIVTIAIIASAIGALVPAIRAARMKPVEALRWE